MHMSPCAQQPWAVQRLSMPPQGTPSCSRQVLELDVCMVVAGAGDAALGAAAVLLLPPKPPGNTRTSGGLRAVPEVLDDLGDGGFLVFETTAGLDGAPAFFLAAKSCEDHTSWQRPSRMSRQPSLVSSAV